LQPAALVSFTGNFSCIGNNCPPANIHWELRESGTQNLVDFGVFQASGAFTFTLPGVYFATPGVYDLYWFGECDGRICVGCQFTITSTGCPCKCDNFERLKLVNKHLGISQSFECNTASVLPLQCPVPGKPYRITGKLNCDPASCKPSNLTWELKNGATVVASGNQAGPWFSVLLDHALLSPLSAGVYDLVLTGTCGTDTCICIQRFDFSGCTVTNPCPCDTQAEKDSFFNAVTTGFTYTYDFQGDCAILIKAGVDNCDQVSWKIEGLSNGFIFTGNTQGSQSIRVVFPTNRLDNYKVTMTVTRPGTTCSLTYCSYVNLNCLVVPNIMCEDNLVQNGGFNSNTRAGILGHGGNTDGWTARSGNPEIWDGDGCNDPFSISLIGKCSPIDIDIIDYRVFIDEAKDGYKFSACYWNSPDDLKPGTHLVIRLSDDHQETAVCSGECVEIARIPIDQPSGDEWRTISTSHLRQQVSGDKFLTLHLENDLAYDEKDANSVIMLDNICFEQDNTTTVPTSNIIDVNKTVRLYPNPNTGQFILEFDEPVSEKLQIQVSNLTGQLVYAANTVQGIAKQTVELNGLASGMYFVQVLSNGQIVSTDRFVKQ
jgi:hypothetical protein